jgi:hypothetical protein
MSVGQLQRINDPENFSRIAACASGVVNNGANNFLGIDEEYCADGQCHTLRIDVCCILVIDHIVQVCDLAGLIGDDRECQFAIGDLIDILDPPLMGLEGVCTVSKDFNTAFIEFGLEFSYGAKLVSMRSIEGGYLSSAHGSKVFGMGEENGPAVCDKLVEPDRSLSCLCFKVGSDASQSQFLLFYTVDCAAHV